jgi:hypothetical protein
MLSAQSDGWVAAGDLNHDGDVDLVGPRPTRVLFLPIIPQFEADLGKFTAPKKVGQSLAGVVYKGKN